MSYGSCTATQFSTAKLEISLLLKPSASVSPTKHPVKNINEGSVSDTLEIPVITRSRSWPSPIARRNSESPTTTTTSAATTPSLATAGTSRQPSLTAISTPDLGRASMELSLAPRPILPPLRNSPPQLHQPIFFKHSASQGYVNQAPQNTHAIPQYLPAKRQRTGSPPPVITHPAKRQSKWTPDEDAVIIELRGSGMKWEDISKKLPGRSAISCRLHYQNYLERRSEWDEEKKNRLARLYERLKPEMWSSLAAELGIPWRAAEAMHWQLGETGMASRAGVTPFSLSSATGQQRQPTPYQIPVPSHRPEHQRGHSDPQFESMYHQQRYAHPQPDSRHVQTPQPPSLPMPRMATPEKDEIVRLTRPSSPAFNKSPGEQSRPSLPSMAELEKGLTAAAMADAHRYPSSSRN